MDRDAPAGALSTSEVGRRLFAKYHGADFALCMEVRNAAGLDANRSADALGIGLWPSRGCHVHGFEIKVSRADWLRELKSGAKADAFHRYCDYWHLVVGDKGIVRDGELPDGWGLLVPHGDSLREIVTPAKIDAAPMPRGMMAAFIKRASEQAPLGEMLTERYNSGKADGMKSAELKANRLPSDEYTKLREQVDEFYRTTGIYIGSFKDGAALKDAMNVLIADRRRAEIARRMTRAADDIAGIAASLRNGASELTASDPTP